MVWDIKRHIIMPLALVTMVGSTMIVAHAAERELPYKVNVTFITASDMDTMTDNGTRGGAARLAAVVRAERAANKNSVFAYPGDLL
ncbi:MAG: hypothetical protein HRU28_06900 [Rhizobiales bacterium]|nr:hypothetical protein [Hyphomicrobiales bacterium]